MASSIDPNRFQTEKIIEMNRSAPARLVTKQPFLQSTIQSAPEVAPLYSTQPESTRFILGSQKYRDLLAQNELPAGPHFIIPERRFCNYGTMDSQCAIQKSKSTVFIRNEDILNVHPMRFLHHSPFVKLPTVHEIEIFKHFDQVPFQRGLQGEMTNVWTEVLGSLQKKLDAIAVTEQGKHVILQQSVHSSISTCLAMLILDQGRTPNYQTMEGSHIDDHIWVMDWIKEAGFNPKLTPLFNGRNQLEILVQRLEQRQNGPGLLSICHPDIGGHAVVVDAISTRANTATIRDPLHGWMLTMKLNTLIPWMDHASASFLQFSPPA